MAISYPSSLDSFPNPQSTDLLENASPTLDHWTQHANINDAVEALEAKVGVDGSAVTTSFDYKLSEVTSTDKAVGKTATQTLTNKTLTSPKVNVGSDATADMYYRGADGTLTRIPIGTNTQILMSDGSTPSFQNNPAGSDASTTVKGVVEEATADELAAGTAAGATGARLFANPSTLMPSGKIDRNYIYASFGGTGADGALSISSGTTTIDLGNAAVFTKNYTSISITGTGNLAFTNPNTNGTIIRLKSQGDVTITSSSSSVIDLRNLGAAGGSVGTNGSTGVGGGGAGGASTGGSGTNGGSSSSSDGAVGTSGTTANGILFTASGGQGGRVSGGTASTAGSVSLLTGLPSVNVKMIPMTPGSGGGGAAGGNPSGSSVPGAGGGGAGCLLLECAGALNFTTGTINATGTAGTNGSGTFGSGGGGGGGGTVVILYKTLTANSGTISVTGGSGGSTTSGSAGGAGAAGSSLVTQNTELV